MYAIPVQTVRLGVMNVKRCLAICYLALLITMPTSLMFSTVTLADYPFADSVRVVDDVTGANQFESESVFTPNGTLIVAWGDMRDSGCAHIFYTRSFDGGLTYEANGLMIGMNYCNHSPSLAVSPNGTVYLGFIHYRDGTRRVFFSKSTDDGASFSTPVRVTDDQGEIDLDPKIAVDGLGNVHLVFLKEMGTGFPRPDYWDVFYSRSTDDGATWSPNIQLNDDGLIVVQRDPRIAADMLGHVYVAWVDFRASPTQDFFTYSNNMGQTFVPNGPLDTSGITVYSDYPSVCVDSWQVLHATFSGSPVWPGRFGIYYMRSTDFGISFSLPVKVSIDETEHQTSSEVDLDPAGNIHVIWTNYTGEGNIFYVNSTDDGTTFTTGIRVHEPQGDRQYAPSMSVNASGDIVVTWTDWRNVDYDIYSSSTTGTIPPDTTPPLAPTLERSILSGPDSGDVEVSWNASEDEGQLGGTVRYELWRATEHSGPYVILDGVVADGSPNYGYVDVGMGHGDQSNYFYRIRSVDSSNNANVTMETAGKFVRGLQPGVDFLSIPLIQADEDLENVLKTTQLAKAWFYDSLTDEWTFYVDFKPYKTDLSKMNHRMGLWVETVLTSNLTVAGIVPAQTTIHLYEGWNLVSFPSFNSSYTIADLKVETGVTRVEGYDPSPPYFLRALGDADVLRAGEAYWVRVDADVDWIVEVS